MTRANGNPKGRPPRPLPLPNSRLDRDIYTSGQLAHVLGVGRTTICNWADSKKLPSYRLPPTRPDRNGGDRRFLRTDVEQFARDHDMVAVLDLFAAERQVLLAGVPEHTLRRLEELLPGRLLMCAPDLFRAGLLASPLGSDCTLVLSACLGRGDCLSAALALRQRERDGSAPCPRLVGVTAEDECRPEEWLAAGYTTLVPCHAGAEALALAAGG
jgi:excisionase family DNA binding protein